MIALEAIHRLIALADYFKKQEGGRPDPDEQKEDETAVAIAQRMLNTALPVVRFRCFVELDAQQPRASIPGVKRPLVVGSYIICATTAAEICSGLVGLNDTPVAVRVTLWEQRKEGADMLSGYQGLTKGRGFKGWLEEIQLIDTAGGQVN